MSLIRSFRRPSTDSQAQWRGELHARHVRRRKRSSAGTGKAIHARNFGESPWIFSSAAQCVRSRSSTRFATNAHRRSDFGFPQHVVHAPAAACRTAGIVIDANIWSQNSWRERFSRTTPPAPHVTSTPDPGVPATGFRTQLVRRQPQYRCSTGSGGCLRVRACHEYHSQSVR